MSEPDTPARGMKTITAGIFAAIVIGGGSALTSYGVAKFAFGKEGLLIALAAIAFGIFAGALSAFTKAGRATAAIIYDLLILINLFSWTN
ncbi:MULTISPECIES: hypothetical protein [Hyphomonas]|uniref:hypothetical protein n=1 Tax=Hyphomonas TaxID=85 RepID=UPI003513A3DB